VRKWEDRLMSDNPTSDNPELAAEAHGVHGAPGEDGKMQEEPRGGDVGDEQASAEKTGAGGEAP
jgi:hypothetical protein